MKTHRSIFLVILNVFLLVGGKRFMENLNGNHDFRLNITDLLKKTNDVYVLSEESLETHDELYRRIYTSYDARFTNLHLSDVNIKYLRKQRVICFMIYESVQSFQTGSAEIAFDSMPRSYYIIIFLHFNNNTVCSQSDAILTLKAIYDAIWTKHKVLEMAFYIARLCGLDDLAFKYDPVSKQANVIQDSLLPVKKINNFQGYPLRVKFFNRMPTAVKNMSAAFLDTYLMADIASIGNVAGLDGFVLANMVKYMNFSALITECEDRIEFGSELPNGTFTGTIGAVVRRNADISFNARFLKLYNTDKIEFTEPVFYDKLCVLVPKASRIPTWRNIFLGFSTGAWYMIMVTAAFTALLWWLLKSTKGLRKESTLVNCCTSFVDISLLLASRPIALPTVGRERIFIAGCLVFNIIFSGVFQGYLNTAFSTISHYPDINTLKALDESGLFIASSSNLSDVFGSGKFQSRLITINKPAIDEAAFARNVSAVERWEDAHLLIELKYIDRYGEPLLHVVKECPSSYHFSYIVYQGYPFLHHMNRFFRRVIEAGLNDEWYELTVHSIILHHRYSNRVDNEAWKKLTMVDVQTAFFSLAIGLLVSMVAFVCEATGLMKTSNNVKSTY